MKHNTYQGLSTSGFHRLHYTEWGDADNPAVLICVHGLTRCSRDFDQIASRMADRYRVICPDVVGRGESDWLPRKADYNYPQYLNDMTALIARTGAAEVHWLGTSMGGIIGMLLAAMPGSPITRLVLNDVGIHIPKEALARIGQYIGNTVTFPSLEAVVEAVRFVSPFGPLTDDQWHNMTLHVIKQQPDGAWVFRYDTGIAETFKTGAAQDVDLSPYWNAINTANCPVLLTRGAESDLLLRPTYDTMCAKPGVQGVEFPGVGHAPMFQDDGQITSVRQFLLG
ncbi:MAG: alpha/beta hydrolase [Betaproteobacteria bacterium]|nr:alpha/beta hydrolase [Betaproteobacteria bacterium]